MDINSTLIYFVCFLTVFLLILACGLLRNIFLRAGIEKELQVKNDKVAEGRFLCHLYEARETCPCCLI